MIKALMVRFVLIGTILIVAGCGNSKLPNLTTERIKQQLLGKSFHYGTSYVGERFVNPEYFQNDTILNMDIIDRASDRQARTQKVTVKMRVHLRTLPGDPHEGVFVLIFKLYDEGWRLESGLETPIFLPAARNK
jgi:hypothetical protein